jgi:hypothetical protein
MLCELCGKDEAVSGYRLCVPCQEAIARLLVIFGGVELVDTEKSQAASA